MAISKSKIVSIAALLLVTPATSEAVNCPPGALPQRTETLGSEIVITDTREGLHCHSAILSVSFVNPTTGTVSSFFNAQIDTGADFTVVGADVVQGLELATVGPEITLAAGAPGSEVQVKQYSAMVQTITGRQVPVRLMVMPKNMSTLVLGRDFLTHFTLIYDGKLGKVSLK